MNTLLSAFDLAAAIWREQEESPDASDMVPGGILDAANMLELAIMEFVTHLPAKNIADIAAKERIANHIERALDGALNEAGQPITTALRHSITCDIAAL